MALPVGSRLGPYEIVAPVGAGGMGEVYRARDTRLGRDVALKVLAHSRSGDSASHSRFEREARALAALNHPYIASIHDVVGNDDHRAIVMELVAGPTLAELMTAGPLPVNVVIDYAINISDALSAAHAAGIVHRDLKPANIVVTKEGTPKVLDFGVAKLTAATDSSIDQTRTATLTQDRDVIGTVGYMSPEQAHGHSADARSDVFSLGAVMYEALSGRRAFEGDTTAALLSAVVRDDPPRLRTIIPATPRAIERCVMRCLQKDPGRRYQDAADLKAALEDLREDLTAPEAAHTSTTAAAIPQRMWHPVAYAAVVLAAIAALTAAGAVRTASPVTPRYRPFITEITSAAYPVWSPDGKTLAYVDVVDGQRQVFIRGTDASQSTQVTTEPASTPRPFWAPDGSRIYFVRASDGRLVSVSAGGGEPQPVAEVIETSRGSGSGPPHPVKACITADGRTIVFTRGEIGAVQLWMLDTSTRVTRSVEPLGMPTTLGAVGTLAFSPDGSTLAVLASTSGPNLPRGIWLISWPGRAARHILDGSPYRAVPGSTISWMPDSRRVLVSGAPVHGGPARLLMVDTISGTQHPLTGGKDTETSPSVSPDGTRVAFVSERSGMDLLQFPVNGGPPEPLLASSRTESYPDVTASGLLAYVTDADGYDAVRLRSLSDNWSRPLQGPGELERAAPPGEVRLSPDGRRVAVVRYGEEHVIWVYPAAGGTPVRLDSESSEQHAPSWSPDGNWIAYRRLMHGAFSIVKAPLGGGEIVRLDDANAGSAPTDWSPAGQWVAHYRRDGLHLVAPDGSVPPRVLGLHAEFFRFSRDGSRLFAVRRGENRRWELTIWDVTSGRELRVVALPLASVSALQWLALSPDETRIIVSAGTNTADIWLLEEFEPASSRWRSWFGW